MKPSTVRRPPGRRDAGWLRVTSLLPLAALVTYSCRPSDVPDTDQTSPGAATQAAVVETPVVRLALGWRAREVERRSTAQVRFPDDDYSVEIFEDGPVALSYADPAHAFMLPPGRYLRVDQVAGRVYVVSASPQMDVLAPEAALALADSVARLLEGAGWRRDTTAGLGARAAVAEAARAMGAPGTGTIGVGRWHIPRSPEPWAAVPPDPVPYRGGREGVDATLTVRPIKGRSLAAGEPRLLLTLRLEDDRLGGVLTAMSEARRARHGGDRLTLGDWDQMPTEPLAVGGPR